MKRTKIAALIALGCGLLATAACHDSTAPVGGGTAVSVAVKDGDSQTAAAGTALPAPLRVTVLDATGQPVPATTVSWSVVSGGGSLSAPASAADAAGVASISFTLGPAAGAQQVQAVVAGLTGSPVTFTETATVTTVITPSALVVAGGGFNVPERFSSDLWVANGYAYTGTWGTRSKAGNAVKIWQLGAGGAPTLVDSIIIAGVGTVSDLEVTADGQTLVVTTESGANAGLYLYSVATPGAPVFQGRALVSTGLHTGSTATIGGRTYAFTAKDPGSPALIIYDITDPTAPTIASQTPEPANYGIHDTYVRDGLAFVFIWDSGFRIYDVGNGVKGGTPASPQLVSSYVTAPNGLGGAFDHNGWWFHNPNTGETRYRFVGQEGPGHGIGVDASGDIHVIDVSNLNAPVEVAYYHLAGAGTHNFWMDEAKQVLYAAYYNGGVVALDVSGTLTGNLADREISRIAPGGSSNTFVWGVQLYNGFLYAIDMVSGFWQLARTGPAL